MASESLSFDILARDRASGAFRDAGRSAADLGGKMDLAARNARVLDESLSKSRKAADASVGATLTLARADKILADAEHVLADGALEAEFALKKETEAARKSGDAAVRAAAENRTLADSLKKIGDSSFFKPSALGTAAALSPALIPLAGVIAAGIGAIGVSFGAATIGAGLFGLAAKSVLAQASTDAQKLSALNAKLATAQTAAQKKAVKQQIEALTIGWAKGYTALIGQYQDFHQKWKAASQAIAVPALTSWLGALTKGLPLLVTAVKPVAAVFQNWGQILKDNFASPAIMKNLQGMAAAFGRFSASQLTLVGGAIADIALGVFHLGKDLAGSGANFSAAGTWFYNMGASFLSWSKSSKARSDVQGFLGFMHQNGGTLVSVLKDLGKILPGIFQGVSGTGQLELEAISGFLGFIAKLPKGWQAPLTEAAGALLLLSKTGVLKVGFTVVGAAAGWVKKLLGGASVDIGAAGMQTAGDTMLTAAAAMQKAADTMVGGAAAGGAEGAGARAAGTGAAGAGAAVEGTTVASLAGATLPVAMGLIGGVAIAYLVNNDAASKASAKLAQAALTKNNLTPGNVATGKQTGGVVPGVPNSAIGSWKQYDNAVTKASGDQAGFTKNANIGKQAADALAGSVAAMHQRNTQLADQFENNLIPDLQSLHADTPKVRNDVQNLADSILNSGNQSRATRSDRQKLITDLTNAGLGARQAQKLVDGMQGSINKLKGKTVPIDVHGSGSGNITFAQQVLGKNAKGFLEFHHAGGMVGGHGNRDTVPAMLTPGEAIVPRHLVPAVAPFLHSRNVPGFASGGLVGPGSVLNTGSPFVSAEEKRAGAAAASSFGNAIVNEINASLRAAAAAAKAARAFGGGGTTGATQYAEEKFAASLFPHYGWSGAQILPLGALWTQESGWNRFARNPSSGAYGIPQALPASKMGAAANPPQSSAAAQIAWGLSYIAGRYGSPAGAWAHERAFNWYGNGLDAIFRKPTLIGVGERGPEHVRVTPRGRGGGEVRVVLELRGGSEAHLTRALMQTLKDQIRVSGGGDVQVALGTSG